ncbi:hypothetical protein KPS64_gp106 [Shigella phage KPS64]|uniref:Uncharacterized protein n=4 Tax=Mooglevirus TaxID=1985303 RepID=A0A291AYF6_9CAUD|nr:hypothetical protein FDI44_gp113 [Shigella phage Sf13]YP_009618682.1 hypothetical protein FDJ00_gp006 [Shigella phage Sf17]ATE86055.1 hypothetical protein Sf15_gp122 [Shigella phage Sf15]QBP32868.1 hypothetical protein KPS64_gp106 [Shigella phage KPS64]URY12400.1 hypothetical protein [Shigella phage ESh19]URY12563.1 hypothetical protein [Shigella phage ESh20]ATE85836.1 hypothetical protein Sf13_gp36 [Shigella phage Sf13]
MTPQSRGVKGIHPPKGGWKDNTFYIVEVAYKPLNMIHKAMFYTGFCDDNGVPAGYNWLMNGGYEELCNIQEAYYLKAIAELPDEFQIERDEDWKDEEC